LSWEAKEGEILPSGDNTAFYTVPKEGRFWVSVSDETGKKEIALIDATQLPPDTIPPTNASEEETDLTVEPPEVPNASVGKRLEFTAGEWW